MPYPDRFDATDLFPTPGQLTLNLQYRLTDRVQRAQARSWAAIERMSAWIDRMPVPHSDLCLDDAEDAERAATVLEIACARLEGEAVQ